MLLAKYQINSQHKSIAKYYPQIIYRILQRSEAMNSLNFSLIPSQIVHRVRNNILRTRIYYDIAKLELISYWYHCHLLASN